ncbi:MAG TPA: amino acid ABC transporter substrate-binding protein [Accumulibacter sp.]|jgi:glutamate/aspartate transport system substrate-binding protein|nr:amino acid ABC transporter substrate-binding protein [Accumulibacter sp.]
MTLAPATPLLRALAVATGFLLSTGDVQAQGIPTRSTLEKIRGSGTLLIGYREGAAPFSYLDANGQPIGFSLDLCRHVADAIRTKLQLAELKVIQIPTTPSSRQIMLESEALDLNCGSVTNTNQRKRSVAFSVSTFVAGVQALTRKDTGIHSLKDMAGKTVVSPADTNADAAVRAAATRHDLSLNFRQGRDQADSLRLLLGGEADVMVLDDVLLRGLLLTLPAEVREKLLVLDEKYGFEPHGLEFRRQDPQFKRLIDDTLIGLMNSGEFARIYDKWFTSPIPPPGANLDLPMSDALKQLIRTPNDRGV